MPSVCGSLGQVHERGARVGPNRWGRQLQEKELNGTGVLCVDSRQCVVWAFLRGKCDTSVSCLNGVCQCSEVLFCKRICAVSQLSIIIAVFAILALI